MNTPLDDRMERVLRPFERDHDRLRAELMALLPAETPGATPAAGWQFWKGISPMKHRILRVGAAVAAAAVVAIVFLWPAPRGTGIVLADVLDRLLASQAVTFRMVTYVQGNPVGSADVMVMDHLMRIDSADGITYIFNSDEGLFLAMDPATRTATVLEPGPWPLDFFRTLAELRDAAETPLGERTIDGRKTMGFASPDGSFAAWVDVQTGALIQAEDRDTLRHRLSLPADQFLMAEDQFVRDAGSDSMFMGGQEAAVVTTFEDFVFNAPLDASLFDLSKLEEYTRGVVDTPVVQHALGIPRAYMASHAKRLVHTIHMFVGDHGHWPERLDLESLGAYGIDERALANPRQPQLNPGWVYIRPTVPLPELANPSSVLILHEAFTTWDGVTAGFADGHVEFISDQKRFEQLLAR